MPKDLWLRARQRDKARRFTHVRKPRKPRPTRIFFGRHRGKLLTEIPSDYLAWLLTTEFRQKEEVEKILNERDYYNCVTLDLRNIAGSHIEI